MNADRDSVDLLSREPVDIDHEHQELHDGNRFLSVDVALLQSNTTRAFVVMPQTVELHFVWRVSSDVPILLEFYEGPTFTGGIPMPFNNKHRDNPKTLLSTALAGVSVSAKGMLLDAEVISAGPSNGSHRSAREWDLNPEVGYLILITAIGGKANVVTTFDAYEIPGALHE